MFYNFDEIVDRRDNNAAKYDERKQKFGTEDVIPLWIADMDFKVAKPIEDALLKKAGQGIFGYVSRPQEYWDALCRWQKRRNNWIVDPSLLSFSCGVVPSLAALVRQFSKEGEAILIQPPVYPEFYEVAEHAGRQVLTNRLREKDGVYEIDFEDFEAKLKLGPKAFILCNPQNPVGRCWKPWELKRMGDLCVQYQVPILSDEIHGDLMLWENKHTPMAALSPEIAANTITCTAVSKTFNLAGLQASTVIFNNRKERERFETFWHSLEIHRNNCFSLVASTAAYQEGGEWLEQLITYLEGNMRYIHEYCRDYIPQIKPDLPECTYLVWLDCRALHKSDEELNRFFIREAKLGLNAGCDFDRDLSGYMRLNAACPRSVLEKALGQLKAAVEREAG